VTQFKGLITHNSTSRPSLGRACITQWISTDRPANVKTSRGYGSAGTLQLSSVTSLSYPLRKLILDHPTDRPEGTESQSCPQHIHARRPEDTLQALTQDISMLSHTLAAMQAAQFAESTAAQSTAAIEATCLAKYSLSAAIAAMQSNTPLPNLDVIARNHNSWMETTKQMGITNKLSNRPHPAEESRLTARCIGIVKGKHRHIHNDPYAEGERSGKCTKPDALSTANAAPPTVKSTPGMTLPGPAIPVQARTAILPPTSVPRIAPPGIAITAQADTFASPPTCAPRIAPSGIAITTQADTFAPPPSCAPRITPPGPVFTTLLEVLAFYAMEPTLVF
jgi:hypothetical protein